MDANHGSYSCKVTQVCRSYGVSLIEVVIVLAIVAILVASALPSFRRITTNHLLLNNANEFASSLFRARAEAIKARRDVRICPTSDNATCDVNVSYATGWIMFTDLDNNGAPVASELIQIAAAMDPRVSLSSPVAFAQFIEFKPSGNVIGNGGNAGQFTLCSGSYHEFSRLVSLTASGRVASRKQANLCLAD